MPRPVIVVLIAICFVLSACSLLPDKPGPESAPATTLSPPTGPARKILQEIHVHWRERHAVMLCALELDAQHIAMAGLSTEGISLFNLNYDGKTITLDKSPLMADKLPPEYMVQDLQWVFWPLAVLQQSLLPPWRISADDKQRKIFFEDNSVTEIDYLLPDKVWPKSAVLINHRYGYRLEIKTLSYEAVPE